MLQVALFKLITGEEVIGKIVKDEETSIVLDDIRSLIVQQSGQGQVGVALVPWFTGMHEGEIKIEKVHIVGTPISRIPKQLEDVYLEQTSKIQLKL